ncbi:Gypsy retrotransposon integrase-like protein 1 [Elysia marginata]|uniref:Gypsy retrotransposon integrase-like protein 1 n=1 Tax=Elysia marginata TaxID=1093978 RepID=A0AAV4HDD1_9GAST|nr:Gypsy retrotransposon integrase-like protein 1 [Elysia marginata]
MDLYDMYADKATKIGVPEDKKFLWIEEKVREHTEREERALARQEKRREVELEKRRLESEEKRRELESKEKKREMEFELKSRTVRVRTFCCEERVFPTAIIDLQSQYFSGRVEACVLENPIADVILGNITGIKSLNMDSAVANPVKTRAQDKNHPDAGPNACSNDNVENINLFERFADFVHRQKKDPTLELWLKKVGTGPVNGVSFVIADDLLYRDFVKDDVTYRTLAVPQSLRDQVLSYAHEATLTAHAGYYKTLHCIQSQFSWPSMTTNARNCVKSCHVCQIKTPAGRDKPAPFQRMPLMEEPFQRVVIDLVGPLPFTKEKWAEATPLRQTTADKVAEALFDIFTRVGLPKVIQSNRGQQFMSKLLQEFKSLSNIKHISSTPYHPQTNGVVERFHSTLKNMLRKLADQSPSDWNRTPQPPPRTPPPSAPPSGVPASEDSDSGDMDTDLGSALSADPRGCPLSPLVLIQPKRPPFPGPVKAARGKRYKGLAGPPSGGLPSK